MHLPNSVGEVNRAIWANTFLPLILLMALSPDSEDDWLMELCVAPRPQVLATLPAAAEGSAKPAENAEVLAAPLVPAKRDAGLSAEHLEDVCKKPRASSGLQVFASLLAFDSRADVAADGSADHVRERSHEEVICTALPERVFSASSAAVDGSVEPEGEPMTSKPGSPRTEYTFQSRLAEEFWRRAEEEEERSAASSTATAPAAWRDAASASSASASSSSAARRVAASDNSAGASSFSGGPSVRNPFAGRPIARMLWDQIQADRARVSFAVMERGAPSADDCLGWVAGVLEALSCGFKFGVSACPAHRFFNKHYGYAGEGASRMVVLHKANSRDQAGALERRLIAGIGGSRCRNVKPGGEGLSCRYDGAFYTYVVLWL